MSLGCTSTDSRQPRSARIGLDRVVDRARPDVVERVVRRRAARWAASSAVPAQRPELLGDERDHRVGERERLAQDVQRVACASSSPSYSRGLTISRYQSHSSLKTKS